MPLINLQRLGPFYGYLATCKKIELYVFGTKENENVVREFVGRCNYIVLSREKIESLIEEFDDELVVE